MESSPGWAPPIIPWALCQRANLPPSSCSRTEPRAGPCRHLASSIPRKQSWEIPLPGPALVAACPASVAGPGTSVWALGTGLPKSRVSGHTGESFCKQMPQVSSQTGQDKVSVSRSDPKNRLLDASRGGWVCSRHTPHGPAPPDLGQYPVSTGKAPGWGGWRLVCPVNCSLGAWVWELEDLFPPCFWSG